MTWRDKLEIGLKENAQYRKDNLPVDEAVGPEVPQGPGRSAEIPHARDTAIRKADDPTPSETELSNNRPNRASDNGTE